MRRALATLLVAAACTTRAPSAPEAPRPAAPRVEVFTSGAAGFDTHTYWIDTGREVVAFDAQFTPALAQSMIADIQRKTDSPIKYLVITHPNPDKFNGAPAFQAVGAKVVASQATAEAIPTVHAYKKFYFVALAKLFTEENYPTQATVDITFTGDYSLPLEEGEITLHELAHAGVSSTQTVAHLPAAKALLVGDLVHHQAHAWLEGGIRAGKPAPDLSSWRAALDELRAYPGSTVYGGRGVPAPVEEAVPAQQAYLLQAEAIVRDYQTALGSKRAELHSDKASLHHQALRQRLEAAFPSYALSYLVEYSVYGLLQ